MDRPPLADLYVTGSDQVWGPTEDGSHDPAYCLVFTPEWQNEFHMLQVLDVQS